MIMKNFSMFDFLKSNMENFDLMENNLKILIGFLNKNNRYIEYVGFSDNGIYIKVNIPFSIGFNYDGKNYPFLSFPCKEIKIDLDSELIAFDNLSVNFMDLELNNIVLMS